MATAYESEYETELEGEGFLGALSGLGSLASGLGKLGGLASGLGKLGGLASGVGKLGSLAGGLGKLGGAAKGLGKLGAVGKIGGLGKLGSIAGKFGKFRTLGGFINNASPLLKSTARMAAPMVGTAIGGPLGAIAARMLTQMLKEGETGLHELENEFELQTESHEALYETAHEIVNHELEHHEALAEMMAEAAEQEQHELQAEAMAGAAVMTVISPADRVALRKILPNMVRANAILTRILRANPRTRPAVRAIPTIARRTVRRLKRQAAAGIPITRRTAGRAAAREVGQVLGNPVVCATAMANNVRATRLLRAS